jgi:hypothetical protein
MTMVLNPILNLVLNLSLSNTLISPRKPIARSLIGNLPSPTRLAVLNSATEILKTHRKPVELNEVLSLASQLEIWAFGK